MGLGRKFFWALFLMTWLLRVEILFDGFFFHIFSESSFYVALISLLIVESEVENF